MSADCNSIRILPVDGHALIRQGIVGLVADQSDTSGFTASGTVYDAIRMHGDARGQKGRSLHFCPLSNTSAAWN